LRVLLTAAPGGHSAYAYAIGYHLARLGAEPVFLAPRVEWLWEKLSRVGEVLEQPMPRRPLEPLYASLPRWPRAFARALENTRGADALVAAGSNQSLAPAVAARLRGLRVYSVESVVRILEASASVKLLYRLGIAHTTLLHWEDQLRHYPRGVVVGPIYEPREVEPCSRGYVLVTAGTVGHPRLFQAILDAPLDKVIVQTGRVDPGPLRRRRPEWEFVRYTPRLHELIACADAVITHFPAMTPLTARLAYGKPTVMVAAPHLRTSSRLENGPIMAEKINAVYLHEPAPEALVEALDEARRLPVPSLPEGAREAARLILGE